MQGKVVLITGAKGGLGSPVTELFLSAKAKVAGVARVMAQSDFPHPNFYAFEADLSSRPAAAAMVNAVLTRLGQIDALVHVVGGFAGGKPVHETDDATWQSMRQLNFDTALYTISAVIPQMRQQGAGRIVVVGSKAAEAAHANLGAYVVFKSALAVLTRTVALENAGHGITANLVLPGTMDTAANRASDPQADFSQWVAPLEVAKLILWLAGDEAAAQLNGTAIPVDRNP